MAKILFVLIAICFALVSSNNDHDIVRIINSGSTNTAGYVIELQRNGHIQWTVARRNHPILSTTTAASSTTTTQNSVQLPSFTNAIFEAVEQASPFTQFPPKSCIKSVSFGTTLHVTYNGQQTPDLSCPLTDARLIVLSKNIHELIAKLQIKTFG